MQDDPIPLGLCQCGCGQETKLASSTNAKRGYVKGEPRRFVTGHYARDLRRGRPREKLWKEEDRGYETPCWIWHGSTNGRGYGRLGRGGTLYSAHRYFWIEANGPVPDGLELDHLCEIPQCVNPAHLEPVTHTENIRRGKLAKLTAENVRMIRSSPLPLGVLARATGVSTTHVKRVLAGVVWKDVQVYEGGNDGDSSLKVDRSAP